MHISYTNNNSPTPCLSDEIWTPAVTLAHPSFNQKDRLLLKEDEDKDFFMFFYFFIFSFNGALTHGE